MTNKQNLTFNLYNPTTQDPDTLLDEFIDRKNLLARILDIVQHNTPKKPPQHVILVGPRGMGKTTLLCALKYRVERNKKLAKNWLPIQFQEEQYGIGDLADFWLEALRYLETDLKPETSIVDQLLHENADQLAEQAQEQFYQLLAQSGKRVLLLVDNINDIFTAIDDGHALNKLRALWMTDARMMVVGTTPSHFEEIATVDQAFHDFFRIFSLDRLTQQELEDFLRHFAEIQDDDQVIHAIEHAPQRIAAMRILTGGNPRLVKLGYRVLREGIDGDVRHDLERLLDECTPFFKHRIESLAKEARRTFDAIARRWDPVSVDEIRLELRKPSNYISAQIKRLIAEGFIEAISGEKKKRYQVSERFYNVYYLMRHSREGRRRLHWLVSFMQVFYTRIDYKNWAKRLGDELSKPLPTAQRSEKLSFLHAMSAAADRSGRSAAFEAMVCDAMTHNDRNALDAEITSNDPIEQYGFRYFALEILWLLEPNTRAKLGFKPSDKNWWIKLRQVLHKENQINKAKAVKTSKHWHSRTAPHASAVGIVLDLFFDQKKKAEEAYQKAIDIDPQYALAWHNLGFTLGNQGRYKEAEEACQKTIDLDPQYALAWNNLGLTLGNQDRYKEAEKAYQKAIDLDPQYVYAWYRLGFALNKQSCYQEAEEAYQKTIDLDPQYVYAWNNLGITLNNQGRYKEAEEAYQKAIDLDPQYVSAWNNLGSTLNNQGRYKEAEEAYQNAIDLDPQYVFAWNGLGVTLDNQGRYKEAEKAYRKAIALDPLDPYPLTNLSGTYLFYLNQQEEGIALLLQGLSLEPEAHYGRYVLESFWQAVLPVITKQIITNSNQSGTDNLRTVMTETLLAITASGEQKAVLTALLALDETAQQPFEAILLALQALEDRSVLYQIAREKRDVVLDVMKSIAPDDTSPNH